MNETIRRKLSELPDSPGCYLMKDSSGKIIYVGKAVNLKNRVSSYFRGKHDPKTQRLVEKIADFETVLVSSEAEALILEANLIKEHEPHYNILLRDDKHYPYLRLTLQEDYPRLLIARRAKADGSRYFGPYPSVGSIHHAREVVGELFPLRTCVRIKPGQRACLNAHIGRCSAPCIGRISKEDYHNIVEQVSLFLQGKMPALIRSKEKEMQQAAEELRFEEAARIRDSLKVLRSLAEQQKIDSGSGYGDFDVVAIACAEDIAVCQLFFVRQGTVVGRSCYSLTTEESISEPLLMYRFLQEYYGGGDRIPGELYLSVIPDNADLLAETFSKSSNRKVRFIVPRKGEKLHLLNLVKENAAAVLNNKLFAKEREDKLNGIALDELRQVLDLERTPARIECYDISHIQGTDMVGSMVVFQNGVAAPKLYRRFKIKTLDGSNDFAALQEVLERRWLRGISERERGKTPLDFGNMPDLIVIDGGKGQLSAVIDRLDKLPGSKPPVISLAKQFEEIYLPGKSQPVRLPYESQALRLLQRLRDEAHRFAITYHRSLRKKRQTRSALDEIPGIGPVRRQNLLKVFGSFGAVQKADIRQLASVPGMNKKAAAELYEHLHAAGKTDK